MFFCIGSQCSLDSSLRIMICLLKIPSTNATRVCMFQKNIASWLCSYFFNCFLLEYSCFTRLCSFLLHSKVNQLCVYVYPLFSGFPFQLGHHSALSPGEGNGSPLQYSCLKNPVDGGAWWAAVHRAVQSRTRLRRLSMHACIGEGNGNPLQYSCLENPRDGGAWWAAAYGVAQSQTRLKRLSSSSSTLSPVPWAMQ